MNDWLAVAATITGVRDLSKLPSAFIKQVKNTLQLTNVWVVQPCAQGRKLQTCEGGNLLEWEIDNFTHPFAHVFQSSSPMLLDPAKLNYWLEDPSFVKLMGLRKRGESVLIVPLPLGKGGTKLLVTVTGSAVLLGGLLADQQWRRICEIFINQIDLLKELGEDHRQISALSSSIKRIRSSEEQREKAFELKQVLIGESTTMQSLRNNIVTAAHTALNVLICGETGTGKELVARAIHELSDRKDKPFVAINCAAIPENLLESELFGHVKGAFSGAERNKAGLVADAEGGTLFLDEIGDMPIALQAKLLRVLESRTFRPVGATQEVKANFRLVAATHVAMQAKIEEGAFRRDLFYRLNQFPVFVPALAERKEDIPNLCSHFISEYNRQMEASVKGIRYAALDLLNRHAFPGNVRELKNLIEYACAITSSGDEIRADSFSARVLNQQTQTAANNEDVNADNYIGMDIQNIDNLKAAVQEFECSVIRYRLSSYGGDRTKAAESLGLPKRTLAHKCLKMEIGK
ncbi:sigma-54 interaction domain-containing protein [Enterovibrio paralichthyis]|uniref:sigma-54 interaction domain-containing protein n=1 Tax=Enterovibrio paralichthyis TaxID=2853805 RepID=UPI001C48F76B|nr:sigma 54-interacting transcriptional regulator [Enterovibrio paralichthyis]MBV7298313.1 sigma 54-interacting transcriptional regulator [Enterovibrio paralichthyis]